VAKKQAVVLLPYLSKKERDRAPDALLHFPWEDEDFSEDFVNKPVHVNFNQEELEQIVQAIRSSRPRTKIYPTAYLTLRNIVENERASKLQNLVRIAENSLSHRGSRSIASLFSDIRHGTYQTVLAAVMVFPKRKLLCASTTHLSREIGLSCRPLKSKIYSIFYPTKTFNNMSGDVDWITFSPNGKHFAASATNTTDSYNQDYNNPMNLVVSLTATNTILELADHWTPREKLPPKPLKPVDLVSEESKIEAQLRNEIEAENKFKTQDPRLFHTVPMTAFSPDSQYLYSVGFDATMNVYDTSDSYRRSYRTLGSRISLLNVNQFNGLIAVGCTSSSSGLSIFAHTPEGLRLRASISSDKALARPDLNIHPSCLKWGTNPFTYNHLLAGFSANENEDTGGRDTQGEICLYKLREDGTRVVVPLHAHSGAVMDTCWNPIGRTFAVGMISPTNKPMRNKFAKSIVRLYDLNGHTKLEFDCVAKDINDVVICPYDDNYIAVGATDSNVYIFDSRMPDEEVSVLRHRNPLAVSQDDHRDREDWDSGVRFTGWAGSKDMLVTGSSDGVLKRWNILQNDSKGSEIIQLNSGITSGAFSPDYTKFVVGEINRSFTMLEIGQPKRTALRNLPQFDIIHAPFNPPNSLNTVASHKVDNGPAYLGDMNVEFNDSKRSRDRLPTELMASLKLVDHDVVNLGAKPAPLARLVCAHCGRSARSGNDQFSLPLCERCGFACFSCGDRIKVNPKLESIKCRNCKKEWAIGALGYHLKGAKEPKARLPQVYELDLRGTEDYSSLDAVTEDSMEMLHDLWELKVAAEPKKEMF
jgi:WD40 repeat protein